MDIGEILLAHYRKRKFRGHMIRGCAADGTENDTYLERHHIIKIKKRKRDRANDEDADTLFGMYLHQFHRSDTDRSMHDHPWGFVSVILSKGYWENCDEGRVWRKPGSVSLRPATHRHWVELAVDPVTQEPIKAITLFFVGPQVREWGFYLPEGWLDWKAAFTKWNCF